MKKYALLTMITAAVTLLFSVAAAAAPGHGNNSAKPQHAAKKMDKQKLEERHELREQMRNESGTGEKIREEDRERLRKEAEGQNDVGQQTKQEMQQRKEERKQIKQEYKDAQRSGEGEKIKGKKPWWKFWGGDDAV